VVTDAWLCDSLLLGQRLPVSPRYRWRPEPEESVEVWKLFSRQVGMGQNPGTLVNPKIAGKWMFIPLKMYL